MQVRLCVNGLVLAVIWNVEKLLKLFFQWIVEVIESV